MKRWQILVLAVGSLLLCVAAVVLWVDSVWHSSGFGLAAGSQSIYGGIARRGTLWLGVSHEPARRFVNVIRSPVAQNQDRFPSSFIGFGWIRGNGAVFLGVPLWLLAPATGALGVMFWRRRPRRFLAGTCRRCGYDLRATPDRCPECGTIA
jgi:hypothetical protein